MDCNLFVFKGLSILLSCILYRHHLSEVGIFGIIIVFLAIFMRIYYGQRDKKRQIASAASNVSKVWHNLKIFI